MSDDPLTLHINCNGKIVRVGADRALAFDYFPEEALFRAANYLLRRGGGRIVVHRRDGTVKEVWDIRRERI